MFASAKGRLPLLGVMSIIGALLLGLAWQGSRSGDVAYATVPAGLAMSLDVNPANGLCNDGAGGDSVDTAATVFTGSTHVVGVCLSGQSSAPNSFEAIVSYNPAFNPMTDPGTDPDRLNVAPEIATAGDALDDNPDANDGAGSDKLGTGWSCFGGIITIAPTGDDTGTPTVNDARIICDGSGGTDTQELTDDPGLLATITFTASNPGVDSLVLTTGSNIFGENCGGGTLTCQNATITKVDAADLELDKSCLPVPAVAGGQLTCTLTVTNNGTATAANPIIVDFLPDGTSFQPVGSSLWCFPFSATITSCGLLGGIGPLAPSASAVTTIVLDIVDTAGGKLLTNAAVVYDGEAGAIPPKQYPEGVGTKPDPDFAVFDPFGPGPAPAPVRFAKLFAMFFGCLNDRYDGTVFDQDDPPLDDYVDLNPLDECDNAVLAANPVAPGDLSDIEKSGVAVAPVAIGDPITWTVNIPNNGLSPAPLVTITDTVEAATQTLVSATLSGLAAGVVCEETDSLSAGIVGNVATCTLGVDNDLDGLHGEDPADDDGDGAADEDPVGDSTADGAPGFAFIDDDQDGSTDESLCGPTDDDEDDLCDEDTGGAADDDDLDTLVDEDEANDGLIQAGETATLTVNTTVLATPASGTQCFNNAHVIWGDPEEAEVDASVTCVGLDVTMYKDKHPETGARDNVVNLWICEDAWNGEFDGTDFLDPGTSANCDENGEGRLLLAEVMTSIFDPEGLGAFEFQVKFDHKIFDINVEATDFLYSTGRIPFGTDGETGGCNASIFNENAILFGCVSKNPNGSGEFGAQCSNNLDDDLSGPDGKVNDGCPQVGTGSESGADCNNAVDDNDPGIPAFDGAINDGCPAVGEINVVPGPTGNGVVAVLEVLPESDLKFRLHPGQENGIVRRILDENCEAADIFGDPLADATGAPLQGIVTGGLVADCDDVDVTVRILEGDLNIDCVVDIVDDQMIAFRYGAFFGSLRYDPWYDLEPALKDFDIDIKDLQKVFGRNTSTCSQSGLPEDGTIPAQPPQTALSNGPL